MNRCIFERMQYVQILFPVPIRYEYVFFESTKSLLPTVYPAQKKKIVEYPFFLSSLTIFPAL